MEDKLYCIKHCHGKIELLKVPVAMGIIVTVMTLARKASMIQNGLFVNKPYKPVKYHYKNGCCYNNNNNNQ